MTSLPPEALAHPSPRPAKIAIMPCEQVSLIDGPFGEEVIVQLIGEAGCFRMIIEDDGVGFDLEIAEQSGGQGLRNIRERAAKIGANCSIISSPGQGTKISIELDRPI